MKLMIPIFHTEFDALQVSSNSFGDLGDFWWFIKTINSSSETLLNATILFYSLATFHNYKVNIIYSTSQNLTFHVFHVQIPLALFCPKATSYNAYYLGNQNGQSKAEKHNRKDVRKKVSFFA